jgi:hypothetical protein
MQFVLIPHTCRPVVAKVFSKGASRTCCYLAWVLVHRGVKCIAANDLMDMGGRYLSWFDKRVETLDTQC